MSLGSFGGSGIKVPRRSGGGGVGLEAGLGTDAGMEQDSEVRFPHPPTEISEYSSELVGAGSRVAGTVYQNTSGRKRRVVVHVSHTAELNFTAQVDSVNPPVKQQAIIRIQAVPTSSTHSVTIWLEVPDGQYYQVSVTAGTLNAWYEVDE